MTLLFDQNLSRRLSKLLAKAYPGSEHVSAVGLSGATDRIVWQFAADHGFMVVSKDSDFRHLALFHGPPPKVIWIQTGNGPTEAIKDLLLARIALVHDFAITPDLGLLVLQ